MVTERHQTPAATTTRALTPQRRVVLLGASNVARAMPTVFGTARQSWGWPLDIMTAAGHGRGYGHPSWVLGRGLPPIIDCGLWSDLATRAHLPTAALITDVGNDLLFMANAEQIAGWIQTCLQRLESICDEITLTQLPLESLQKLTARRFLVARALLFPQSRATFDDALNGARTLNQQLIELAHQYGAKIVEPSSDWYGWDPIHIRSRFHRDAWSLILGAWQADCSNAPTIRIPRSVRFLRPQQRHLFGIQQRRAQPSAELNDGSSLSFY